MRPAGRDAVTGTLAADPLYPPRTADSRFVLVREGWAAPHITPLPWGFHDTRERADRAADVINRTGLVTVIVMPVEEWEERADK